MSDSKSGLLAKLANSVNEQGEISGVDSAAVQSLVDTSVNSLINSAPEALNTLDELASALNDDANFASTVTTSIATKANSADVYTQAEVDTALAAKASTSYVDSAVGAIQGFSGSYGDLTDVPFGVDTSTTPTVYYSDSAPIITTLGELWYQGSTGKSYRAVDNPVNAQVDNTQATVTNVLTEENNPDRSSTVILPAPGGTYVTQEKQAYRAIIVFNTPTWLVEFQKILPSGTNNPQIHIERVWYEDGTDVTLPANTPGGTSVYTGGVFDYDRITQIQIGGTSYSNEGRYRLIAAGAPI